MSTSAANRNSAQMASVERDSSTSYWDTSLNDENRDAIMIATKIIMLRFGTVNIYLLTMGGRPDHATLVILRSCYSGRCYECEIKFTIADQLQNVIIIAVENRTIRIAQISFG